MICEAWDVAVVPFPFTDRPVVKRRPALVLSKHAFNEEGHTVLAMITTAAHHKWPGDVEIEDLRSAGLHARCLVRLKLFTIDNRLILRKLGHLGTGDRRSATGGLRKHLA